MERVRFYQISFPRIKSRHDLLAISYALPIGELSEQVYNLYRDYNSINSEALFNDINATHI